MVQRPLRSDAQGSVQPAPAPAAAPSGGAPDPRAILDSIGEVVYDWDVVSDRLTWGPNALNVLGVGNLDQISSGRSFGSVDSITSVTRPGRGLMTTILVDR